MASDREFRFHDYTLIPARRLLLSGTARVKLGSRAFDVLLVLVEHHHRIVSKHELMATVWPRVVVEENNLEVHVLALRKLLGHPAISTIPGRGYHFTLPVSQDGSAATGTANSEARGSTVSQPPPMRGSHGPLLGRDNDLRSLRELIQTHRLVTVAGGGGIGKTRLARAAAQMQEALKSDGNVWWVELAGLTNPAMVPAVVARALGLTPAATEDLTGAVVRALRGQAAMLVLDNAEHLLDGVAAFVSSLREAAPRMTLLVTSQEVLRVSDEQVFRPGPLRLPVDDELASAEGSGAVALFVARARQAQPHFELRADNRAAIVDICRQLDGLPLAIELAAARLPLLGVDGIRARLDERFRLLTAGARATMQRHHTLRATLEWSHGLLTARQQMVFRRLGVFAGGFSLDGAQSVVEDEFIDRWDVLDELGALVDKSLVVADGDPMPRYRLLESTRLYALEQLTQAGETEALLRRHAEHALAVAEALDATTTHQGQATLALMNVDDERDNLLHALDWCAREGDSTNAEIGLRIAGTLRHYWASRGLTAVGLPATLRALDRAAALPADEHRCKALGSASQMLLRTRQTERARALAGELLTLGEALEFQPAVAVAHHHLGCVAAQGKDWASATAHFEALLDLARRTARPQHACNALEGLADTLRCQGRLDEAAERLDELLDLARGAGHGHNLAVAMQQAARLARDRGDDARSVALLLEALPWVRGAGSHGLAWKWSTSVCLRAATQQRWTAAVQVLAGARRRREAEGLVLDEDEEKAEHAALDGARNALGDSTYLRAQSAGIALSSSDALELAAAELLSTP
jgi:predicted ATPase/DNA-binding winged helix-turn-helix (wHTH) protein